MDAIGSFILLILTIWGLVSFITMAVGWVWPDSAPKPPPVDTRHHKYCINWAGYCSLPCFECAAKVQDDSLRELLDDDLLRERLSAHEEQRRKNAHRN